MRAIFRRDRRYLFCRLQRFPGGNKLTAFFGQPGLSKPYEHQAMRVQVQQLLDCACAIALPGSVALSASDNPALVRSWALDERLCAPIIHRGGFVAGPGIFSSEFQDIPLSIPDNAAAGMDCLQAKNPAHGSA